MTSNRNESRAVSFSVTSELYVIHASRKDDISAAWYSSREKRGFRQSMLASIRQVTREIEELPPGATMTDEQLLNCLGIESFLTKGAARNVAEMRRAHIDAVLSEQSRQKQIGKCNVERISRISQKGSLSGKERAWKLARGYAAMTID